jgi:undecaprenyl phosphate N,N'-diacetylbacillosamine 1-phosphate transferase
MFPTNMYNYNMIKVFCDFLISFLLLILLSPLILIVAILLFFIMGEVIFKQKRPGLNGKIFTVYKFKSMNDKRDEYGVLLSDELRINAFGKIIRKLSIDELPQLLNVLFGEMSIVGPRPLLPDYLTLYNSEQMRRHEVKPGITGWAQVNGRNTITWDLKFSYDIYYVDNLSLQLDLQILKMTVLNVIRGTGVNQEGFVSADNFKGNNL